MSRDDEMTAPGRREQVRTAARGLGRLRAAGRRALGLLLGCALVLAWVGSARAVCGMPAAGGRVAAHDMGHHSAHPAMRHAAGHAAGHRGAAAMQAAMAGHGPARDARAGAPGDDGCPMRDSGDQGGAPCPALLHCVAGTAVAAPAVAGLPRGPDAGRATRAPAHGPLLGASEAAAEPVAPPPRG